MKPTAHWPLLIALVFQVHVSAQLPFDLDTNFRTSFATGYANSVYPLADGRILVSGKLRFDGEFVDHFLSRLEANGALDPTFPANAYGSGRITPWNGMYYVGGAQLLRRVLPDGTNDPDYIAMNNGPYFNSVQGGDYHVYPDGRILMSGAHLLQDSLRGFEGIYNLIWFSNEGYLDTTKTHREGNGAVYTFKELPDGKFICASLCTQYDGQPTNGTVFRVHADGSLDPTFTSQTTMSFAGEFLPLPDGRCYAAGVFAFQGEPDSVQLVRFMPDGSQDPTFHSPLFGLEDILESSVPVLNGLVPFGADRLIVMGAFELVEGESRQGICMIDTAGNLVDDYFTGPGCGDFEPFPGLLEGSLRRIVEAPDGSFYICGAYHGYDDGTTNDTLQRFVSRLYGLDVGLAEPQLEFGFTVFPNPAQDQVTVRIDEPTQRAHITLTDCLGRVLQEQIMNGTTISLSMTHLPQGIYHLRLVSEGQHAAHKLITKE